MSDERIKRPDQGAGEGRLRLFCALDPPGEVIDRIVAWQRDQSQAGPGLRAVRPEALHVTLAFLGDRPERDVPRIARVIEGLTPRPVAARLLTAPVPVPRRRPRLLALEAESTGAESLAAELTEALVGIGVYEAPKRPFWPHLTVFRVRRRRSRDEIVPRPGPLPGGDGHAFGFVRVALYRSQLRPEGSKYSRLAATDLPQPGGPTEEVK